ncbi:MAG: 30S ribosomal protein S2 [Kiritimatiellaeota bacterium]|nr:30S ribosomal protein S2 [Kiritimatiellota bacterium]
MAKITVQDLLAAGVHFGHQTKKWNPKMKEYVYGVKNGIYIIDLAKTMRQLADACNYLQHVVADGGDILFVGTKRQAQNVVKEAAEEAEMYYVTERWLGGTLTNNNTIRQSVTKMRDIDKLLASDEAKMMRKKELSSLGRQSSKIHRNLGGILDMRKRPDAIVIVDICQEHIAVDEAYKLGIPIVAIIDTNANPDKISHPIVANDDALKSISLIVKLLAGAVKSAKELYLKRVAEEKVKREEEQAKEREEKEKARKEAEKARREAAEKAKKEKAAAPKTTPKADGEKVAKSDGEKAGSPAKAGDKAPKKTETKPAAESETNTTAKTEVKSEEPKEKKVAKKAPAKKAAPKKTADKPVAEDGKTKAKKK